MRLEEIRDLAAGTAKEMKEKAVQRKRRPVDIAHFVEAWRGDAPIATALFHGANVHVVAATQMAAVGFDADVTVFCMESFTDGPNMTVGIHPITGKAIEGGDFNEMAANGGIEAGYVSECLFISATNRAGDISATRLKYHYAVNGQYLMWDERWVSEEDMVASGYIADEVHDAMDAASFSQVFPGLSATEESRAELDAAVAKVIASRLPEGAQVMVWADKEGERARTLRQIAKGMR